MGKFSGKVWLVFMGGWQGLHLKNLNLWQAILKKQDFLQNLVFCLLLLCFYELFHENMGSTNELDVLPIARQFADSTWLPQDWYLNQDPTYRRLFQMIFGNLIVTFGFLKTSIFGRFLTYSLIASGLVKIKQALGLSNLAFYVVIAAFLGWQREQGIIAHEWIVGGLEAKSFAYGFVLLAWSFLLKRSWSLVFLLLGFATSFHVLVGGWMFITVGIWLVWHEIFKPQLQAQFRVPIQADFPLPLQSADQIRDSENSENFKNSEKSLKTQTLISQFSFKTLAISLGLYVAASSFAIAPVINQLLTKVEITSRISPSFIYVFFRLPHHLNPLSWEFENWLRVLVYLIIFLTAWYGLSRQKIKSFSAVNTASRSQTFELIDLKNLGDSASEIWRSRQIFAELVVCSLIPFIAGLLIAPWDSEGKFLQYYPFRLGDVLLPLGTYLLLVMAISERFEHKKQALKFSLILSLSLSLVLQISTFVQDVRSLQNFPGEPQKVSTAWQEMSTWIRTSTPTEAIFISAPVDLENFSWLTERSTIAKYKLLPQSKQDRLDWLARLQDLSPSAPLWEKLAIMSRQEFNKDMIRDYLTWGYDHLTLEQIQNLRDRYHASYLLVQTQSPVNPVISTPNPFIQGVVVHQNPEYTLYQFQ